VLCRLRGAKSKSREQVTTETSHSRHTERARGGVRPGEADASCTKWQRQRRATWGGGPHWATTAAEAAARSGVVVSAVAWHAPPRGWHRSSLVHQCTQRTLLWNLNGP